MRVHLDTKDLAVVSIVLFSAVVLAFVAGSGERRSASPAASTLAQELSLQDAYQRLREWSAVPDHVVSDLVEDLAVTDRAAIEGNHAPTSAAIVAAEGDDGLIYVCHLFWGVAICWIAPTGAVRDARWFNGKAGFSMSWDQGLIITCHEHPGTGLFWDTTRHVAVAGGSLTVN